MYIDARTHGSHDLPISKIHLEILNVGPISTQFGFHWVNRTAIVVENAKAILTLSQHQAITRFLAISSVKFEWIDLNMSGDAPDVRVANIGAAKPLTTITALAAEKNTVIRFVFGRVPLRAHVGSPLRVGA